MNLEGRTRKVLLLLAIVGLVAGAFSSSQPTEAATSCQTLLAADNGQLSYNQLLEKQACVQQALTQNQNNLKATQRQASNLQGAISSLDSSINQTESQISNTQNQISTTNSIIASLNDQINANQTKLNELNAKLKNAYSNLYELSQTSTVEMLIQSKSISDLLNQSQYIEAIQSDLQKSIADANSLAADLKGQKDKSEQEKASLENLNNQLSQSKSSLDGQKAQKSYLLSQTKGDQARYASLLNSLQSEVSKISSDLYQKRLALGGFINSGGNGGYPYANSTPDVPDQWGFLTRECTSYAAFAFQRNFGRSFNNTRPGSGSAYNWDNLARDQGYTVSGTARVGDVIRWNAGSLTSQWGHVAVVEAVFSQSDIVVSEYNWSRFSYTERRINPSSFGGHSYIRP